jgi:hypothetical protein
MYLALPDAIHIEQPGCRAYAARHFKASAVWDMLPPAAALRRRALRRTSTPVTAKLEVGFWGFCWYYLSWDFRGSLSCRRQTGGFFLVVLLRAFSVLGPWGVMWVGKVVEVVVVVVWAWHEWGGGGGGYTLAATIKLDTGARLEFH